jgi:hypothetical protein
MTSDDSQDIDWAGVVDLFASEYGWTIDYIKSLDLSQIVSLRKKMQERHDQQNGQASSDTGTVPSSEEDFKVSDFETKLGGTKKVREDGTIEIVI